MKDIILNQIVAPLIGVVLSTILGVLTFYIHKFLASHKSMVELQKQALIQKIGIDKYNADVALVQGAVATAEQLGKEFDWKGALKHTKVLEMIEGKTGLSDEEIFNAIKAAVAQIK